MSTINPYSENRIAIAILDWDDTLIPTTQMFKNKQVCDENHEIITINQLENIGKMVYKLLLKYITLYGRQNMFIITNASRNWVSFSLDQLNKMYKYLRCTSKCTTNYFEAIKDLLASQTINIISGKDLYKKQYPNQWGTWKNLIFQRLITEYYMKNSIIIKTESTMKYSVISIGDSVNEFKASYNATKLLTETYKINPKNVILHRIKLKHSPSIKEITDEMQLILTLSDALYEELSISQTIDYEQESKYYCSV
eukprot:356512_1